MIQVFDLHNDLPTLPLTRGISGEECEAIFRSYVPHRVVRVFWTTEMPDPAEFIELGIRKEELGIVDGDKNCDLKHVFSSAIPPSSFLLPNSSCYAVEDLWFASDEKALCRILNLPLLYAGLTWNRENALAGGADSDGGLTEIGKTVVKKLIAHSIVIDTAHLNERSFYDVLEVFGSGVRDQGSGESCQLSVVSCQLKEDGFMSRIPNPESRTPNPDTPHSSLLTPHFLNSHTCLKSIHSHPRNLTDAQIKLLLSCGGVVGITAVAQFMGKPEKQGARADYLRQIDSFAQKFGISGLCIGSDFNGTDPVEGLSSYADFEFLAQDLFKLGYSANDVERIFHGNAERFFKA
ncbi:MAG: dipeptidase [Firmicutes bacterium]|nr:dipeptidase [Bacillota bacterium]